MGTPDADHSPVPQTVLEGALEVWGHAGERHYISIIGASMLPLLRDGDQVLVAHGHAGLRRGDLVVFRRQERLIAHRMLRRYRGATGPQFLTKGDNSSQPDPLLNADEIVGRVLAVKRGGRQMSLDTPAWRTVGWLIAVAALAWGVLYGCARRLKQRLLGPEPTRVTTALQQGMRVARTLLLKIVQRALSRWEG